MTNDGADNPIPINRRESKQIDNDEIGPEYGDIPNFFNQ